MSVVTPIESGSGAPPPAPSGSVLSFGGHRQALFGIVSDLKRLQEIAAGQGAGELSAAIRSAVGHVERHGFSVAVVGEFKRGKSTLINALLGKEILPADITPTSATINRVTYGLKPAVRIVFRPNGDQGERVEDISIDQLAHFVTKLTPEAEAIAATVKEAVVSYPVAYCKNNVDIIDTPGLNDDPAMTRVTLGILPQVDAAILVTLATSPFALSEGEFLDSLLLEHGLGGVLFVVTALDRIRKPEDRERVLAGVTARIEERIAKLGEERFGKETEACRQFLKRVGRPRVFGISGSAALQAKISHDPEMLAASRFPELEAALERFLTEESGLVILKTQAERILGFCKELLVVLDARAQGLAARPAAVSASCEVLFALLDAVQRMGRDELREIDADAAKIREGAREDLGSLAEDLKEAAEHQVAATVIAPGHLEPAGYPSFKVWLQQELSKQMSGASRTAASRLQAQIRRGVEAEAARLLPFAMAADRILAHVRGELARIVEIAPPGGEPPTASLTARLGGRPGFGGPPPPPGSGPALAGPGEEELAQALALSPDWAASLDVRVATEFPGGKLTKKISDLYRVETFKRGYRNALAAVIDAQVLRQQPDFAERIHKHVAASFEALIQEVETLLQETRSLLVEVRGRQERIAVLSDGEQRNVDHVRAEVRKIRDGAQSLAFQLSEMGS